jgi:hypothetical protein
MAATDGIVRLVSATFGGTAIEGAVAMRALNMGAQQRGGRNNAQIGLTSLDTTFKTGSVQIITDDENDLDVLALTGTARLVIVVKGVGGSNVTYNIGSSTQTTPNGAIFTGTEDMGDGGGPTIRTALNFTFVMLVGTHTKMFGTTTAALVQRT